MAGTAVAIGVGMEKTTVKCSRVLRFGAGSVCYACDAPAVGIRDLRAALDAFDRWKA